MTLTDSQKTEYKEKAAEWARERLADSSTVVLDIESTGLLREDPDTEIAQICITDLQGRSLFNMLLKPSQPMGDKVIGIHRITNEQVLNQPIFPQIAKMIAFVLKDKHVVAFNAEFDWVLLLHMFKKYDVPRPEIAGISCCMDRYSEWCGEWSTKKNGFKWQRLPNFTGDASHDAYNDCRNTVKVMEKMAGRFNEAELDADSIDLNF